MNRHKCEFCNNVMEHDCSNGVWDNESHLYICVGCGATLTLFENGQEPVWEENY